MAHLKTLTIKGLSREIIEDQLLRIYEPSLIVTCGDMIQYYFAKYSFDDENISVVTIKSKDEETIVVIIFYDRDNNGIFEKTRDRIERYISICDENVKYEITEDKI